MSVLLQLWEEDWTDVLSVVLVSDALTILNVTKEGSTVANVHADVHVSNTSANERVNVASRLHVQLEHICFVVFLIHVGQKF